MLRQHCFLLKSYLENNRLALRLPFFCVTMSDSMNNCRRISGLTFLKRTGTHQFNECIISCPVTSDNYGPSEFRDRIHASKGADRYRVCDPVADKTQSPLRQEILSHRRKWRANTNRHTQQLLTDFTNHVRKPKVNCQVSRCLPFWRSLLTGDLDEKYLLQGVEFGFDILDGKQPIFDSDMSNYKSTCFRTFL